MKSEILSDRCRACAQVRVPAARADLTVTMRHMSHGIAAMGLSLERSNTPGVSSAPK